MENDRIIALLESMIETTEGIQANLEKMKIHCNNIQSILSSRSSTSVEPPESVQDLGEHMRLENHHSDEMQFSNYRTPRSAEIGKNLEEVTGIQVSVVLPSHGDNGNTFTRAIWKSSELKMMDSPWTEVAAAYCLPAFQFVEEGTFLTHQVFDKMPKGSISKYFNVTMCFDPGIRLCSHTRNCPCNACAVIKEDIIIDHIASDTHMSEDDSMSTFLLGNEVNCSDVLKCILTEAELESVCDSNYVDDNVDSFLLVYPSYWFDELLENSGVILLPKQRIKCIFHIFDTLQGFTEMNDSVITESVPVVITVKDEIIDDSHQQVLACFTPRNSYPRSSTEGCSTVPMPPSNFPSGNGYELLKIRVNNVFNSYDMVEQDRHNRISLASSIGDKMDNITVGDNIINSHVADLCKLTSCILSVTSPVCFDPGIPWYSHKRMSARPDCAVMVFSDEFIREVNDLHSSATWQVFSRYGCTSTSNLIMGTSNSTPNVALGEADAITSVSAVHSTHGFMILSNSSNFVQSSSGKPLYFMAHSCVESVFLRSVTEPLTEVSKQSDMDVVNMVSMKRGHRQVTLMLIENLGWYMVVITELHVIKGTSNLSFGWGPWCFRIILESAGLVVHHLAINKIDFSSDMIRTTMEVNEKFLNDLPWTSGGYMGPKGLFQCLHPDVVRGAVATLAIFFWWSVAVLWATYLPYSRPKTMESANKLPLSTERGILCCDCSMRYTAMSVSIVLQSYEELQFCCHNATCVAAVYAGMVNPGIHIRSGKLNVASKIFLHCTFNTHSRLFMTCLRCLQEILSELKLNRVINEGFVLFLISSKHLSELLRKGIIIRAHHNGQILTQVTLRLLEAHKLDLSVQDPWWEGLEVPSQTLQRVSMHLVMSAGLSGNLQLVQQDEWKGWSVSEGDTYFIFSVFFDDTFNWGISSARSVETFSSCSSLQQKNDPVQNWVIHIILPRVQLPHYGVQVAHHLLLITVVHCCASGDISIFRSGLLPFMNPTVMGSKVAPEYPFSGRVIMFYDPAAYSTSLSFGSAVMFIVQYCHWGPRLYFSVQIDQALIALQLQLHVGIQTVNHISFWNAGIVGVTTFSDRMRKNGYKVSNQAGWEAFYVVSGTLLNFIWRIAWLSLHQVEDWGTYTKNVFMGISSLMTGPPSFNSVGHIIYQSLCNQPGHQWYLSTQHTPTVKSEIFINSSMSIPNY